jgi:translation initiation factor 1A
MLGASKMLVRCKDDKVRIARIPGRIKRKIWIKEGDVVIVKPWSVQSDEKCDIVWRYTKPQVNRLMNQGVI